MIVKRGFNTMKTCNVIFPLMRNLAVALNGINIT